MIEHTNIPPKHINTKGSVGGRKRSGYHVMMMQTEQQTYPLNMSMPMVQLEEKEKRISCNDDANRTYKHTS